ncbi:ATP-binding protein [Variovorax sp. dw_308]|uniref:ATP-binding protein n=1 Tax=Variovorax sp. dw_308 TaxID=2721546 RepID=UPI002737ED16|nr:ATP-binding protein [Variovorax sp. dw_308]
MNSWSSGTRVRRHVTSNLDLIEWHQAFPANKLLASATLDRMRHNAYCLVLEGKSYQARVNFRR